MSSWLSSLPHQLPFRAASSARRIDERTIEGTFLCGANDALTDGGLLPVMIIEAMAQIGGGLAFGESGRHGFLSGIEEAEFDRPPEIGDRIDLRVRLQFEFQGLFRFEGVAEVAGKQIGRARFYLAAPVEGG